MSKTILSATLWLFAAQAISAVQLNRTTLLEGSLQADDTYGFSVAVQDGLSVVGAIGEDDAGDNAGAAFVFDAAGNRISKLTGIDTALGDQFGSAVALDNGIALVGARFAGPGVSSGAAYLFNATTGGQLHKLTPSDGGDADDEQFGHSVALRGGIALIGAPQDWLNAGMSDAGAAYLYDATTGAELQKFRAPDAAGGDLFGYSVAIGDGLAVIGAPFDDDRGSMSGSAYLFELSTGAMLTKIVPADGKAGDQFGYSVAISNGRVVVGAGGTGVTSNPGAAYLFDVSSGDQLAKWSSGLVNKQDQFGESVAISGSLAIVGAPGVNTSRGAAYLFDTTTGSLVSTITSPTRMGNGEFGVSVALDGQWAAVGEPMAQTSAGASGLAYRYYIVPEPSAVVLIGGAVGGSLVMLQRCRRSPGTL